MKEEIQEFKNRNGGIITYSTKELIGALHIKIEKMYNKFNEHCIQLQQDIKEIENKEIKHDVMIGILYVILIGLLLKVIILK